MKNSVHGITSSTMNNLWLDAGKVVLNYGETTPAPRDLGATIGGNSFAIETEYKDIRPDGARGAVKGGRRITDVTSRLTVNLAEITKENLMLALPGSASVAGTAPNTGYDIITRTRNLLDTDHVKNIAFIGTISGKTLPVVIVLKNPLADGNLEISGEDKEEGTIEVQFTAHFDPAAMEVEPWEIRYPTTA